jgi:hypothetical protein
MARSGRRRAATLAEVRTDRHACAVCQRPLTADAHVAWTVGRARLHEKCLDEARLIAAHERLRSAPVRVLPLLLQRSCVCASCLALRLGLSLQDARDLMQLVDGANRLKVFQSPCASCGRYVDVLCNDVNQTPNDRRIATRALQTCRHCIDGALGAHETAAYPLELTLQAAVQQRRRRSPRRNRRASWDRRSPRAIPAGSQASVRFSQRASGAPRR